MRLNSIKEARSEIKQNLQLIGFNIGARLYGVDIFRVVEILRHPDVVSLEKAPELIEGAIRVRSVTIPVINLAVHIGRDSSVGEQGKKWVLVSKVGECLIGFVVDAVTHILKIDTDRILPAPDLILAGLRNPYIRGVCETEKGLLVVLELDRLLLDAEVETIRRLNMTQMIA